MKATLTAVFTRPHGPHGIAHQRVASGGWRVAGEGRPLNADCENCIFVLTAFTLRRKALATYSLGCEGALHASLHTSSHAFTGVTYQRVARMPTVAVCGTDERVEWEMWVNTADAGVETGPGLCRWGGEISLRLVASNELAGSRPQKGRRGEPRIARGGSRKGATPGRSSGRRLDLVFGRTEFCARFDRARGAANHFEPTI